MQVLTPTHVKCSIFYVQSKKVEAWARCSSMKNMLQRNKLTTEFQMSTKTDWNLTINLNSIVDVNSVLGGQTPWPLRRNRSVTETLSKSDREVSAAQTWPCLPREPSRRYSNSTNPNSLSPRCRKFACKNLEELDPHQVYPLLS